MSGRWPRVRLGEVLEPVQRAETPVPGTLYRQLGVRLWGEGAYERESVDGGATKYRTLFRVAADDVVVNKIWARNGSVAVVQPELDGLFVSAEFPTYRPRAGCLCPRWMHWLTKTAGFWGQCDEKARGTSGKNRIRPEQFLQVEIPLPPLDEQQRIVARIEELAGKVARAQCLRSEAIENLHLVVPSRATEIFDNLRGCRREPIRSLGAGGSNPIQIGPFGAQLHASEFTDTGVPVLNVGNVWPTGIRLDRLAYVTPAKAGTLARYTLEEDDLLFARSGATLGKVCLVPRTCAGWLMTGHLFRVRFDRRRCLPTFALLALREVPSIRDQVFSQVRGATRPGFNTTLLGNVELPIPPLRDQERIIQHVEQIQARIDSLRSFQEGTSAELDALLRSILHRAFNGDL